MKTSLSDTDLARISQRLSQSNATHAVAYPGESGRRQPVHTVYGGAHLFAADSAKKLGEVAQRALQAYAPDFATLARALELKGSDHLPTTPEVVAELAELAATNASGLRAKYPHAWLAHTLYSRVTEKLRREAVEDFRIDFEDGYGNRPDAEEDGHAAQVAREIARGMAEGTLPPFIGIRIKPFSEELKARSIRTLDIVVSTLVAETGGKLPDNFVVTLPKIWRAEQVEALADMLEVLERQGGLSAGALKLELMIETTQSIFDEQGRANVLPLVRAARGRCVAAHFGTYDYTASCNITAAHQHMVHPACDFARHVMQVALAGTGVWLSDGATNVMPVGPHRAEKGSALSAEQQEENRNVVHRAWKLHYDHIQHSLVHAYYQGWDLHPAQFATRYAAVYAFFLESLDAASDRLRNFVQKAAQATLIGDVFDDAATGQGLLNFFLRAINCGAITEQEATSLTSLSVEELRGRSFVKILENRRG